MSTHTVEATTTLALHALTTHMVDHGLPAPPSIDAHDGIRVWIHRQHLLAWLNSGFHDTGETITPRPAVAGGRWERVDVDGHLPSPIGDVKVRLSYVRSWTGLAAVTA